MATTSSIVGSGDLHLRGQRGLGAAPRRLDDAGGGGDGGLARTASTASTARPSIRSSCSTARATTSHSWGAGQFAFPHAIRVDERDNLWLVDREHGQMLYFTPDGELLRAIGTRGYRSDTGVDPSDSSSQRVQERHARRRSVQPADGHRADAGRRDVRHRRLRQCPRAQVRRRRHASPLLGRAGRRPRAVQPAARHLDRQTRPRAGVRPRERPRAGVRPGGQPPARLADQADRAGGVLRGRRTTSSTSPSTTAACSAC